MKIITFAAIKGGVGKTTLAYNYGEWLANQNSKVLFIDLDHQSNLTQIYQIYDNKYTVANIFLKKEGVQIHHIKKNIDLIAGDMHLDSIEANIQTKVDKNMLLYMWLADNYDSKKLDQYDYIIIDCHPDFSIATKNAVIISDDILSPITPSEHGYSAKFNLEERFRELKQETIDYRTRQSLVDAKLLFVGNMIKNNTRSSRELLDVLQKDASVIVKIPNRELFNRSTLDKLSISSMMADKKMQYKYGKFFNELNDIFSHITSNV
ncbi:MULTISPECIES: ParA family protein [Lactobacillus]|uniref:ParA family protein n=1 Tax=Lactobacillus xujianguonis TaxID=2495899 RepID=A0A437SWK7_9LACO|nr:MULTISPECIES: ParA family protein [Lactobacillus]RVU71240.1 ParA family protein [Lactobacillus xujianguonis]RVU74105.1 ParA family protein [Lactobacillus xujianguonis]